jgi:hypothetical protein
MRVNMYKRLFENKVIFDDDVINDEDISYIKSEIEKILKNLFSKRKIKKYSKNDLNNIYDIVESNFHSGVKITEKSIEEDIIDYFE